MMDHIADKNLTMFNVIRQNHELPEFVKSAQVESVDELPSSSFADRAGRRFPCHTKAATWLSYAYFLKHANDVPKNLKPVLVDRLHKFADSWGIANEIKRLEQEHISNSSNSLNKLADSEFAIVETNNGQKYRALPMTDKVSFSRSIPSCLAFARIL